MVKQELRRQWQERIAAYKASGLSQSAFCREQNISLRQLSYWLRKENLKFSPTKASPTWVPLEINMQEDSHPGNTLLVKVGAATVEVKPGFNQKLLLDVVRTMSVLC